MEGAILSWVVSRVVVIWSMVETCACLEVVVALGRVCWAVHVPLVGGCPRIGHTHHGLFAVVTIIHGAIVGEVSRVGLGCEGGVALGAEEG